MNQPISRNISFFQISTPTELNEITLREKKTWPQKLEGFTADDFEGIVHTKLVEDSITGSYVRKGKKTVRKWNFEEQKSELRYVDAFQESQFKIIFNRALLILDGKNEETAAKYISFKLFDSEYHQKPLNLIPSDFDFFRKELVYVSEAEFTPLYHSHLTHLKVGGYNPDKADIVVRFINRSEARCDRLSGIIEFPDGKLIKIDLRANGKVRFYFSSLEDEGVLTTITERIIDIISNIMLREEP